MHEDSELLGGEEILRDVEEHTARGCPTVFGRSPIDHILLSLRSIIFIDPSDPGVIWNAILVQMTRTGYNLVSSNTGAQVSPSKGK